MVAQLGRLILLAVGNGLSPQTYTNISGVRSRTITINNEQVDVTTSDTAPWRRLLGDAGLRSISITGTGIFEDDAAIKLVEDLVYSGALEEMRMTFPNGDRVEGLFQVTQFEHTGDHVDVQAYTIALESADVIQLMRA